MVALVRVLVAGVLALCAVPSLAGPALAAPRLGIADQRPAVFADKRLRALHMRDARLVVPYDGVRDARVAPLAGAWLRAARAHRVRVLVGFGGSTPQALGAVGRRLPRRGARLPRALPVGARV